MNQGIYQEKNVVKTVMMDALPAMLGQATTLIYNIADTWFVSLAKDADMIAAVTLCAPILLIIMSVANIVGSGGGSLIARYLGRIEKWMSKKSPATVFILLCFWASCSLPSVFP